MKINTQVEPMVREALTAVVKSDPERLRQAFLTFPNDDTAAEGTRIAMAITPYVLIDAYGRQPSSDELRAVAEKVIELENWADISLAEVASYLKASLAGRRPDEVPAERIPALSYIIAGNLLSSYCGDDEWWFDYLDRVEAALEALR